MLEGWKLDSQINEKLKQIPERLLTNISLWPHYLRNIIRIIILQVPHFQLAGLLHKNAVIFKFRTCREARAPERNVRYFSRSLSPDVGQRTTYYPSLCGHVFREAYLALARTMR